MPGDVELFVNSVDCGFWGLDVIYEYYQEYYEDALKLAEFIDWDEVVLYAIYNYDGDTGEFVSADFMKIRMNYDRFLELSEKLSPDVRLFFVRNDNGG